MPQDQLMKPAAYINIHTQIYTDIYIYGGGYTSLLAVDTASSTGSNFRLRDSLLLIDFLN